MNLLIAHNLSRCRQVMGMIVNDFDNFENTQSKTGKGFYVAGDCSAARQD